METFPELSPCREKRFLEVLALHLSIVFTATFALSFLSCAMAVGPGNQHPDGAEPKPQVPPRRPRCRAVPAASTSQLVVGQLSRDSWSLWPSGAVCGGHQCSEYPCASPPVPSFGAQGLVGEDQESPQPLGKGCLVQQAEEGKKLMFSLVKPCSRARSSRPPCAGMGPRRLCFLPPFQIKQTIHFISLIFQMEVNWPRWQVPD